VTEPTTAIQPPPPSTLRRTLYEVGSGTALGFVLACVWGPAVVSTKYTPLSDSANLCGGPVNEALSSFVRVQLISAAVGAVLVWSILFFSRRALRKRREKRQVPVV